MANDCLFTMKVRGTNKKNVVAFLRAVGQDNYHYEHLSRIFEFYANSDLVKENNAYVGEYFGDCVWSVYSCMFEGQSTYYSDFKDKDNGKRTTIDRLCKKYKVECEIFSEEYGIGFQEHYHISKDGDLLVDECEDAYEEETEDGDWEVKGGFGRNYLVFNF